MTFFIEENTINSRYSFIGCDGLDQQNAALIWSLVEDKMEGVLEGFYNNIIQNTEAPQIDADRLPFLITAQKSHWRRMLLDCHDESYIDGVRRIGATHYRMQIEPRWYIAGYAMITNKVIEILANKLANDTSALADLICTLNRHVAVDMDLALTVYTAATIDGTDIALL